MHTIPIGAAIKSASSMVVNGGVDPDDGTVLKTKSEVYEIMYLANK